MKKLLLLGLFIIFAIGCNKKDDDTSRGKEHKINEPVKIDANKDSKDK